MMLEHFLKWELYQQIYLMMTELHFENVYLMKHLLGLELDQQISLMRVELPFWKVLQSLMQDSTDLRPALKQMSVSLTFSLQVCLQRVWS